MSRVVMTVAGPMDPGDLASVCLVSAREWLLNDQAALLDTEGAQLTLGTLFACRRSPLGCLDNLSLGRDDTQQELCGPFKRAGACASNPALSKIMKHTSSHVRIKCEVGYAAECLVSESRGAGLLVVCTPRSYWLGGGDSAHVRAQHMRTLAEDSGTSVILGTTPAPGKPSSAAQADFDREVCM
eukprot:5256079-Amphidinium_carterae.1